MNFYECALAMKEELQNNRRWLHEHAEVGLKLPETCAFVKEKLRSYGYTPVDCGSGVTAELGEGKPCILLRADMDALPMKEETGLDFACKGENFHGCGHDCHAAMLLGAAKLLKEQKGQLPGTIRLMFQPGEEVLLGAADMISHGVLRDVDAVLGIHVGAGSTLPGTVLYNDSGAMMVSSDGFHILVQGRGAHGAYPQKSIDPINIACHIHLALQTLIARECTPQDCCLLTIGQLTAGSSWNIIPDTALLSGSIRSRDEEARQKLLQRMEEVAHKTAEAFGGSVKVQRLAGVPPLCCDPKLTRELLSYLKESDLPKLNFQGGVQVTAADDFALLAKEVPGCYLYLTAGFDDERGKAPAHNPKVQFNEDVLPMGVAVLAQGAVGWLNSKK